MNIIDYGFKDEVNIKENKIIARIISTYKERYRVVCDKGETFAKLKKADYYRNQEAIYPTIGDFVLLDWNNSGDSFITKTLKRKTSFVRTKPMEDRKTKDGEKEQVIAANFDCVFIMQSLNNNFNIHRLERYLTLAWQSKAVPVIILTKSDLISNPIEYIDKVKKIAPDIDTFTISSKNKEGFENFNKYLKKGNTVVFLGSSGVGKSTLVNILAEKEIMKTGEIREEDSRGRHTTTSKQLIMLPNGAMIIDTPGMRELGMWDISDGLNIAFQDVEKFIDKCKFKDCTHTNEPGCRVLEAIKNGELSQDRYNEYIKLKNEARYTENSEEYLKKKKIKFKEISKKLKNKRRK